MLREFVGAISIVAISGVFVSVAAQTEHRSLSVCRPANQTTLSNQQADALGTAVQCVANAKRGGWAEALNEEKITAASLCGAKTFSIPLMMNMQQPGDFVYGPVTVVGKPQPIPPGPGPGMLPTFPADSPYATLNDGYWRHGNERIWYLTDEQKQEIVRQIEEGWKQAYEDCIEPWIDSRKDEIESRARQITEARLHRCIEAFESASTNPATCYKTAYCAARRALQAVCNCGLDDGEKCAKTKLIRARQPPPSHAAINWSNFGCGHIPEAAKACKDSCPGGFAIAAHFSCLSACDAATAQLIKLCAPWLAPTQKDAGAPGVAGDEKSKSRRVGGDTDFGSPGVARDDRGPTRQKSSDGGGGSKSGSKSDTSWGSAGVPKDSGSRDTQRAPSGGLQAGTSGGRSQDSARDSRGTERRSIMMSPGLSERPK